MESMRPLASFQLPFQKRLSSLYSDTKKSSDFVKEPVQNEDPDLKNLYRKLRIQKDRLVSWGLEWTDSTQTSEIDEPLSKAGLSEVVASIMGTIKDILAEAEPLWLSSKRVVEASKSTPDQKAPLVRWDKSRFEDLLKDLTASIDTLYDLSRTRAAGSAASWKTTKAVTNAEKSTEEYRSFESSRIQTPQQLDPETLHHVHAATSSLAPSSSREVVFMSKTAYSELHLAGLTREPWAPLLLEYASYDAIYTATGISPPMDRFEKLSAGLQQDPQRAPGTWTGLPRLLGYFEDMRNSRLGLVYRFPPSFSPVSVEKLRRTTLCDLPTLDTLLADPDCEPALEVKFKLAYNLINTVFDLHARGISHGNLTSQNISFPNNSTKPTSKDTNTEHVDMRRPLLSSFDLFSQDQFSQKSAPSPDPSRHALDPRCNTASPLKATDERVFELYSLATILLTIGLWSPLNDLVQDGTVSPKFFDRLAVRCGSLYLKAAKACWSAVDHMREGEVVAEVLLSSVQMRTSRFLESCCILDGVGGLEDRLSAEIHTQEAESLQSLPAPSKTTQDLRIPRDVKSPSLFIAAPSQPTNLPEIASRSDPLLSAAAPQYHEPPTAPSANKSETKVRLYPHVPLPAEAVQRWNTSLMPQINHALRHFYRKHPESVEISLESVGPSPQKTEPTVVVVCTSVGKIRAILRKRLVDVFEGPGSIPLKVTKGQVVRSRRPFHSVTRSMASLNAGEDDTEAINPEYQLRPGNGSSIGAWIGDRHLPPVSFGGLVVVDDKLYGMTVHHMLDDPDKSLSYAETARSSAVPIRSSTIPDLTVTEESNSGEEEEDGYVFSDTESEAYSDTDITSDFGDDEEEEDFEEAGDIPGIEPGCGYGYVVTQPALDDVEDGFYPDPTTQDEDHLDSYALGDVYASSGLRRKKANGLLHEVDWALFEFESDRQPDENTLRQPNSSIAMSEEEGSGDKRCAIQPTTVADSSMLPGLEVQCIARTSGLQTGLILPALASVRIHGRASPSQLYQVTTLPSEEGCSTDKKGCMVPMGVPGDSGAWLVDRQHGQVCGHVLAWSQKNQRAYICPMDILLSDIAQTLEAREIRLPGGSALAFGFAGLEQKEAAARDAAGEGQGSSDPPDRLARALADLCCDGEACNNVDDDEASQAESEESVPFWDESDGEQTIEVAPQAGNPKHSRSISEQSSSPIRMASEEFSKPALQLEEVQVQTGRRGIGVGG